MPEIRRIRDGEGETVAALWSRMGAEIPDGGPLSPEGFRNIARMLDVSAWHRDTATLVAVEDGVIVGFISYRVDDEDGLLPCPGGELNELYVLPEHRGRGLRGALADAAVADLRERGAVVLSAPGPADDPGFRAFWEARGFEADVIVLSRYPEE
ncbi:MAG TPA: GNAT family N-acetyltransferase [Thermomonospora sp.]|nr:GNAT family N-acetyltransferase [Thermomonospora sp.]